MIDYLKINGVAPPVQPKTYKVSRSDLDSEDTSRNERGIMKRSRIRQGVYKAFFTYRLKTSNLATLTNMLSPSSFTARIYDLTTASYVTCSMYCGDREASAVVDNGSDIWVDFTFNLIQL